jgi:hypothetical protein
LTREIKELTNDSNSTYLRELTNGSNTDYSLWKATKKLADLLCRFSPIRKTDGKWARNHELKAQGFAEHN